MAIEFQRIFHTGHRVPSLDAAMVELGELLNLTWADVRERDQAVWTPEAGAHHVPLRYTYSCTGPQHVELLEGAAGSVWDGRDDPGVHHIGIWVDEVATEVRSAAERGWPCVAAQRSPDDGYGVFAYVQPPNGTIVEVVDANLRPHFEAWWAAGLAETANA